jgi:hypothetical protein
MDLTTSHNADLAAVIGVVTAGALASSLCVVAVGGRFASRWWYLLAVPLGLGTVAVLLAAAWLIPSMGLLPGLDCAQ